MFYFISGKLPFISNNSSRRLFKTFIAGSVLYIALHYYLYSRCNIGILEKVKQYLYYVLAVDLVATYFLTPKSSNNADSESKNTEPLENGYSAEKIKAIQQQQMQILRAKQYQEELKKRKVSEQSSSDNDDYSNKSPFKKKPKRETAESSSDEKEKSKGDSKEEKKRNKKEDSSSEKKHEKKQEKAEKHEKTEKKQEKREKELDTDTNIPVYMGRE